MAEQLKSLRLLLENGKEFKGYSFGYEGKNERGNEGEVIPFGGAVGYPENLTDPTFAGEILIATYPIMGAYGFPKEEEKEGVSLSYEGEKASVRGVVVKDYSPEYSHWNAQGSLSDWLKKEKIVALCGVDTREIAKILREEGTLRGQLFFDGEEPNEFSTEEDENLVREVSCREVMHYGKGDKKVCMVDCGVKHNILRHLLKRNVEVVRVPYDYDFNSLDFDALLISNGPGSPMQCKETIEHLRVYLSSFSKPLLGIGLGYELLALAIGAKVSKMEVGHHSLAQPVKSKKGEKCFITMQNHSYVVEEKSLPSDWEATFVNLNDGTLEGMRHREKPFSGVQFHPESAKSETDEKFLFDDFLK